MSIKTSSEDEIDLSLKGSTVRILASPPTTLGTVRQWTAGIIASLGMWSLGSCLGWSSPSVSQLEDGKGIEGLTKSEISWVASIVMLAALPGCFLGGYLVDKLGRRLAMMLTVFIMVGGWALIAAAQNAWMLILGRIFSGIAGGVFSVGAAVFIAETQEDRLRSKVVSWNVVSLCIGIVYTYIIGTLVSWRINSIISGAIPIILFIGMFFLPETPRYLLTKEKKPEASKALAWYRAKSEIEVLSEFEKLIKDVEEGNSSPNGNSEATTTEKLLVASTVKPVLISLSCAAFCQLSGTSAVTFYTVKIFEDAGSSIEPNVSGILIGTTQAIATAFAGVLMTRFGRRQLFIFSECGMCISLAVLGVFYYLKDNQADSVGDLGWLPLASLISFTITYCCGAGILPWAITVDLCPPHVKGITTAMSVSVNCGLGFLVALLFPTLQDGIQGYGAFWLFASINAVGAVYMFLVLPETKDKTMDEIQALFKKPQTNRV